MRMEGSIDLLSERHDEYSGVAGGIAKRGPYRLWLAGMPLPRGPSRDNDLLRQGKTDQRGIEVVTRLQEDNLKDRDAFSTLSNGGHGNAPARRDSSPIRPFIRSAPFPLTNPLGSASTQITVLQIPTIGDEAIGPR